MLRRFAPSLLVLAVLVAGPAAAAVHSIPLDGSETRLEVTHQDPLSVRFTVEVGELSAFDVETAEGPFTRLQIPGFHSAGAPGRPELPTMNRLIAIPVGATARVLVRPGRVREIDLAEYGVQHRLMPAQPSMPKSADPETWPFVYEPGAYDVDRVVREPAAVVELGRLRAMDLGRLEIAPVEYLPRTNRIRVTESLEVEVTFENADLAAQRELLERTASPFFEPLYGRVANARAFHDAYPDRVGDVVTLVVVTPPAYEATLADWIAWKRERGFHVIVGEIGSIEVGGSTASIQAWLHNLYNDPPPGVPAPSFVVFVGDIAEMPTFTLSGDASDRPYCAVDADLVPDMYYGRLSATSPTQLANILEKTMMFDTYSMPDPSYLGEVVMIAGMDASHGSTWGNGQINYGTTYYFNAAHGIDSHTYLYPQSGSNAANIVQNVSDGVGYINYTAHGSTTSWADPSFTQANIASLQNYGKYCFAVGNCCLTSSYQVSECFAESWLRAEDKGAIGYIGGSNSTYWDEDYWWGVGLTPSVIANPTYEGSGIGAYDGMFHDHGEAEHLWYVTSDALVFSGNLAVMESGSHLLTYYWNIYNLMGDPSLSPYLGVPTANPVAHAATVFTTATTVTVDAVPGSYVGLTQDGALVGAGTVGASGSLDVDLLQTPLVPGVPLHVVVTAQNRIPYVADADVVVPASVTIVPGTIDANVPTALTVTVREADGITPVPGIDVWAEGLDYATTPVATDVSGVAVVNVDYPYGPTLDVVGQEPGQPYRLFTEPIAVNAAMLVAPDLTVATAIGLADTLALNLPATLGRVLTEPGATMWAILPDGTELSTTAKTMEITSTSLGDVTGILAVSGYDLYVETFPVIEAFGTLTGTVSSGGTPLAGVTVQGFDAGMALAFEAVTNASGVYDPGQDILVADYTLVVDHFGYLHSETPVFVQYGANVQDIVLTPAPSGVLTGTVTEAGTGMPLEGTVRVYRADTMELFAEATSDPLDGSYTTSSLPWFDYEVRVRAFHHVPETIAVTIGGPVTVRDFALDPTAGDLLVIDDDGVAKEHPAKVDGKGGTTLAAAYVDEPSKSATAMATALEELGYFVTTEAVGSTDPATWPDYDLVIVSCGDNTTTLASAAVRSALVAHVGNGGKVLVEGGEVGYDHASSDPAFAANVLHVSSWNHDSSGNVTIADAAHRVASVPNVLTGPIPLAYVGYGDADAVTARPDAARVGAWSTYPSDASIVAYDPNPAPEGGQIVYLAFDWSALETTAAEALLENAVLWLTTPEAGTCTVSGTVTLEGEADHSGILVRAVPGTATALTDATGAYTLEGLWAGSCAIVASKDGWSEESTDVTLADGEHLGGVDFRLTPVFAVESCATPGLSIPDNNPAGVRDTVTVASSGTIQAVTVYVDITHTYVGDLHVSLTSPQGTTVVLHDGSGGSADDLVGWYGEDLVPAQPLSAFAGEEMAGDWVMFVRDDAGSDVGVWHEWCVRVEYAGGATDVATDLVPTRLALAPNAPNPFGERTALRFALPRTMRVDLGVYDVAGRRVVTLVHGVLPSGHHRVDWEGRDGSGVRVASGVYFLRLTTEDAVLTRKMLRLK